MDYYGTIETGQRALQHFGIKGMKWGRRRFENYDGTLTDAGKKRYRKYQLRNVDPAVAKNKPTRRAAEDYHKLSDDEYLRKYKTTKKAFARRYRHADGDTYALGKRRQARANKVLDAAEKVGFRPREHAFDRATKFVKASRQKYKKDQYIMNNRIEQAKTWGDGVRGGLQVRKLGQGNYIVEPVLPEERKRIYKRGEVVWP